MTNFFSPGHSRAQSFLVVAGISALALTACSSDEPNQDAGTVEGPSAEATAPAPTQTSDSTATPSPAAESTPESTDGGSSDEVLNAAVSLAQQEHPDAVIAGFDIEGPVYEIDMYSGTEEWEVQVRSNDTSQIADSFQQGTVDNDDQAEAEAVEISFQDALRAAEAEGGSEAVSAALDTEAGSVVYTIELRNDTEVSVNVATGEVASVDRD